MSLNGLDEEVVIEAYQAALAEPGAWSVTSHVIACTYLHLLLTHAHAFLQVPVEICHKRYDRSAAEREWRRGRGQDSHRAVPRTVSRLWLGPISKEESGAQIRPGRNIKTAARCVR